VSTEKQIRANRLNALKAGVKTEEGKAAVRLNAVSHGFFSRDLLLPGEDTSQLDSFRERFFSEFQPVGEMETLLVERILSSAWRLKRLVGSERVQLHMSTYKPVDSSHTIRMVDYRYSDLHDVMRYETTLERQIYRAMHELERLQKMRMGEAVPPPLAVDVAVSADSGNELLPEGGYAALCP
jgi:hypothetical protein